MSDEETVGVDPRESDDLVVHVASCHHRYKALDQRTKNTNLKIDRIEGKVDANAKSARKQYGQIRWLIIVAVLLFFAADQGTTVGAFLRGAVAAVFTP